MKRIKMFLLSAAIVAAGSAFITPPTVADEYVKDKGAWKLKTMANGICQNNDFTHCTFVLKPGSTQPYKDSDFTPNDQDRIWVSAP